MNKKHNFSIIEWIISFFVDYNLIPFFIAFPIIYFIDRELYYYWYKYTDPMFRSALDSPAQLFILGTSYALWGYLLFLNCRRRRYKKLTGRTFELDRNQYKRNYDDMVRYFKDAEPNKLDFKTLPIASWRDTSGVILGKIKNRIIHRPSDQAGNIAIFGLPGDGKTTSVIIPTALRFLGSVFAIDIKGDIYDATHRDRNIKVFSPGDPQHSCSYNILRGVGKMAVDARRTFIENIGLILCPREYGEGRYFSDGARNFFVGISLYMISENPDVTFPEIVETILTNNGIDWVKRIKASTCMEAKLFTDSMYGSNEKNVSGAYDHLAQAVRSFSREGLKSILTASSSEITPNDLNNGLDVYLRVNQDELKLYAPLLTIIVQQFLNAFLSRPSGLNPIIFLLDEFPQLNFDFETLSTALSTLRSRKVTLLLCQQSLSQLDKLYKEAGRKEIMDTCAYYAILSVQDPYTRKYFSDLIGTKKVLKTSSSQNPGNKYDSYGRSSTEAREPVFLPEEFGSLGDDLIIYGKFGNSSKYVRAQKCKYYE